MTGQGKRQSHQVWGERMTEPPDEATIAYCAGRDVHARPMADALLVPYDLWQNRAHVLMLARQGIIESEVALRVMQALDDFESRWNAGEITLDPAKEDVHINIEHFVAANVGAHIAGVMHTARSRNDQTTTVVRLYIRDELLEFSFAMTDLIRAILQRASKLRKIVVAGLTHYQPASVTTLGHWFASYAQALSRDVSRLLSVYDRLNISPLGAAASFGTSWPIDRKFTAGLLGFDAVQENSLDCITNRWEMEADTAQAITFAMTHLSIVSQDLILLSLPQFGIVRLSDRHTTGSSIMPQKRNPDFAEVTRAKTAIIQQLTTSLFSLARGLVSGYNRDTQWTKYLIMDIFAEAKSAPRIFEDVFARLRVDRHKALESARKNFVDAVDVADNLARSAKLPFRQSYKIVSRAVRECEAEGAISPKVVAQLCEGEGITCRQEALIASPDDLAERKNHIGAPSPEAVLENIRHIESSLKDYVRDLRKRRQKLETARKRVRQEIQKLHNKVRT